jgi:alpha-ketoglutarate-dependent taurine dioxygenase
MNKTKILIDKQIGQNLKILLSKKKSDKNKKFKRQLKKNIDLIKLSYLDKKNYFYVLSGIKSDANYIKKIKLIAKSLGTVIEQNAKKEKFVKVTPKLKLLSKFNQEQQDTQLRYHQTNSGGSIHSDGPQLSTPPNYVFLACIKESENGGRSIVTYCNKIYDQLKKNKPNTLKILKSKFLFERRGFNHKPKIFSQPIFVFKKNNLRFRYLREYIETAYKIRHIKMPAKKVEALNKLDSYLENKLYQKKLKLKTGDIMILNNKFLAHGRTKFKINKNSSQRSLLRVWVN